MEEYKCDDCPFRDTDCPSGAWCLRNKIVMKDKNGTAINVGDVVRDKYGYDLIVSVDSDGDYFGKLVCDETHSCRNIPYALVSDEILKI